MALRNLPQVERKIFERIREEILKDREVYARKVKAIREYNPDLYEMVEGTARKYIQDERGRNYCLGIAGIVYYGFEDQLGERLPKVTRKTLDRLEEEILEDPVKIWQALNTSLLQNQEVLKVITTLSDEYSRNKEESDIFSITGKLVYLSLEAQLWVDSIT